MIQYLTMSRPEGELPGKIENINSPVKAGGFLEGRVSPLVGDSVIANQVRLNDNSPQAVLSPGERVDASQVFFVARISGEQPSWGNRSAEVPSAKDVSPADMAARMGSPGDELDAHRPPNDDATLREELPLFPKPDKEIKEPSDARKHGGIHTNTLTTGQTGTKDMRGTTEPEDSDVGGPANGSTSNTAVDSQQAEDLTQSQREHIDELLLDERRRTELLQQSDYNMDIKKAIVSPTINSLPLAAQIPIFLELQDGTKLQVAGFPMARVIEELDEIALVDRSSLSWSDRFSVRRIVTGEGETIRPDGTRMHTEAGSVVFDRDQYIAKTDLFTVAKLNAVVSESELVDTRDHATEFGEENILKQARSLRIDHGFVEAISQYQQQEPQIIIDENGVAHDIYDTREALYNSPVESYDYTFKAVLEGKSIMDLIKETDDPYILDLMAPVGTIVDIVTRLPRDIRRTDEKRGVAVSLTGVSEQQSILLAKFGITQIPGDLTKAKTWNGIDTVRGDRQFTHIFERGFGALSLLPTHPEFFRYAFNRSWEMLSSNNGHMLLQLPKPEQVNIDFTAWKQTMRDQGFAVAKDNRYTQRLLYVVKRPDSPLVIPEA